MSLVTFAPLTTGKALWEGGGWRNKDNACDNFIAGVYQHVNIEFSATEAGEWVSFDQYINQLAQLGMGSIKGINKTGGTLAVGTPVALGNSDSVSLLPTIVLADPVAGIPAQAILLAALTNGSTGYAYIGTATGALSTGINQTAVTIGSPVYVADGGGLTLTPDVTQTFTQVVGYTTDQLNPGHFYGIVNPARVTVPTSASGIILGPTEIDLKTGATQTYVPGGNFNIDEVGLIVTTVGGTIVTQPTVSWGITGTNAKYKAATLTTLLTAVGKRERFQNLLADDAETSLTFTVTSPAAGSSTIKGRPYWKGVLHTP